MLLASHVHGDTVFPWPDLGIQVSYQVGKRAASSSITGAVTCICKRAIFCLYVHACMCVCVFVSEYKRERERERERVNEEETVQKERSKINLIRRLQGGGG
jgi:hypothetical protein